MKQSSKYSSCDAEQNGINIFAFVLKDRSITGVPKLSNTSRCRNKSNGSTIKYDHSDSVVAYYTRWYAVHSVPTSYLRYP